VGPQVIQPQPGIGDDTVELGHQSGLRQGRQVDKRSICSVSTEDFSVVAGIADRVCNQCPEAFQLERLQILPGPAVMCQQLRFAHVAAFERYAECLEVQYL
jgi:hypothetical protein